MRFKDTYDLICIACLMKRVAARPRLFKHVEIMSFRPRYFLFRCGSMVGLTPYSSKTFEKTHFG